MKYFILIIVFVVAVAHAALINLPSYITRCKSKDGDCLRNALKNLVPYLKRGIPLFNIPSIEPLPIPNFVQSDLNSPEMPYTVNFVNNQFSGASDFEVSELNVDLNKLKFNLEIFFPKLVLSSYEIVRVKGFGYDLDGEWPVKETYKNVTISLSLTGTKRSISGKQFVRWAEDQIKVSFSEGSYDVDTSYKNGQEYQAFMNKANSEHPDLLNREIALLVKNTVGHFIHERLNNVHEIFSTDILYQLN